MFPEISRDILYFLERKGSTKPDLVPPAKGKRNRPRVYRESDVKSVFHASLAYRQGLNPDRVLRAIAHPETLRNERLLSACAGMLRVLRDVFRGADAEAVWEMVGRIVCEQVECESCLLFLNGASSSASPQLYSVGRATTARELNIRAVVPQDPPDEWVRQVRSGASTVNLFGESLLLDPFVIASSPQYLKSGRYLSLMAVPVWRRAETGQLRGWMLAENRVDAAGEPREGYYFDPATEAVGAVLAGLIALVAESLPYIKVRRWLRTALNSQASLESFLAEILASAVELTGASRGDIAWRDEASGKARLFTNLGHSSLSPGTLIRDRSISRSVFETNQARLVADVGLEPVYLECDASTRSELCVPIMRPGEGRALGVINVESAELNGFDRHDQSVLEEMADYTALYGHMLETLDAISLLMPEALEKTWHPVAGGPHPGLKALLELVEQGEGFDRGMVYLADYRNARLRCAAVCGYDDDARDYYGFAYRFSDHALATKVFRDRRPYFAARAEEDPNVSPRGLEFFQITGPVVGVPLLFGASVVGVMVSWSSRPDSGPTKAHEEVLKPYASLAVTNLAVAQTHKQHLDTLESIREVLVHMATESNMQILRRILTVLIRVDFDRARVFRLVETERVFECLDSVGRERKAGEYVGRRLSLSNPYAQLTLQLPASGGRAVVRDPRAFVVDPDAALFDKPPDLPWAAAALFNNRKLFGYLVCDNLSSRRAITETNLETLNVLAALAAQAIAMA